MPRFAPKSRFGINQVCNAIKGHSGAFLRVWLIFLLDGCQFDIIFDIEMQYYDVTILEIMRLVEQSGSFNFWRGKISTR